MSVGAYQMSSPISGNEEGLSNDKFYYQNNDDILNSGEPMMGEELEQDLNTAISVEFHDGYSFKYLLEFLKETGDPRNGGNFVFSRGGITFQQANADNTILNVFNMDAYELCEYEFDSSKDSYLVGCSYNDICPFTKNIGKKDRLRMYKLPGQRHIYLHPIKQNSESSDEANVTAILPKHIPHTIYTVDDLGDFGKPIKVVPSSKFKSMCDSMYSSKSRYIKVQGTNSSVMFSANVNQGITNSIHRFGGLGNDTNRYADVNSIFSGQSQSYNIVRSDVPAPVVEIVPDGLRYDQTLDSATIRSLSKLNSLCNQGTIKISMNDNALKLETHIGTYGFLETYIRSCAVSQ